MHNLDRTNLEALTGEGEFGHEGEFGEAFEGEGLGEAFEGEGNGEAFEGEAFEGEGEGPFSENELMELASELLTISSEQELNHFLGGLVKRAWGGLKRAAASPLGRMVVSGLKSVASKALPMAGAALGNMVLPGVGGVIGSKLASGAGKLFGLELEGLSSEDREFEAAKQFVNFAGTTARQAAQLASTGSPQAVARTAMVRAARAHAPGLVPALVGGARAMTTAAGLPRQRSGRWFRRGNAIVLVGA